MKTHLIARYFYSPICPESFVTLDRLKVLFKNHDVFYFESFNTVQDKFETNFPWFPEEKKVIDTVEGNGEKPLLYGKLFIEGKEIKGFPPSPKSLENFFKEYGLKWDSKLYPFEYNLVKKRRWKCNREDFFFQSYSDNLSLDVCYICTKYHQKKISTAKRNGNIMKKVNIYFCMIN
ncbi:hypothetical protein BBF96_12870 [Anoxybacter fermentans]|uniref:Uncharacterized protein n=1 Tax=Anoxybacter fermentans TaxID=1323375 RepID=A0A3S9T1B5_9FIRM|nr:hypothetical protein [Anoxybacter fermentans]AZR74212.1 hypothetical protein BBF96_12870 [Anoxybacter fermentans]